MPFVGFTQINFQEGDFDTCKKTAQKEQKSFMVYITADWCIPCKMMEETTFSSVIIQDMLNMKVTPYKINFDSEIGKKWKKSHNVTKVPTILTFDEHGNQKTRYENALTSSELMIVLDPNHPYVNKDQYSNSMNPPSYYANTLYSSSDNPYNPSTVEFTASTTYIDTSPSASYDNTPGGLTVEDLNRQIKEIQMNAAKRRSVSSSRSNNTGNTLEEINRQLRNIKIIPEEEVIIAEPSKKKVEKNKKSTTISSKLKGTQFEIQLGYFRNKNYAERLHSKIVNQTNHQPITTKIEKNGESFYRVTIGEFNNYDIAESVFREVKTIGFNAYLQNVK